MTVKFADFSADEQAAVETIVERAHALFRDVGMRRDRLEIRMDISAVHATCPLRLAELAEADDFNFAHDLTGIARHLDRETGELDGRFLPRFAQPASART